MIQVALVDDHNAMRNALAELLSSQVGIEVLFQADSEKDLIAKLKWDIKPDVILMDYQLGPTCGIECIQWIRNNIKKNIKIIGLTMYDDSYVIAEMLEAGADGFLHKSDKSSEIIRSIREVHEEGYVLNRHTSQLIKGQRDKKKLKSEFQLNGVEQNILKSICGQKRNEEIANELNLSPHTVNTYRKKILKKTKSKNTAGLVLFSIKHGIYHV